LLEFAHGQMVEYPRDGLYLFGPCDAQKLPGTTRYGVIRTREGVERFGRFSAVSAGLKERRFRRFLRCGERRHRRRGTRLRSRAAICGVARQLAG
jgi:hypothetical protein